MKFILISPKNRTVYNFRGNLIKELVSKGYEVVVTGPDLVSVDKICELGARFRHIPMNKTGTSIKGDLQYYKTLKKLIKEERPDVILSYTVKPVVYGTLAAKKAGVENINCMITGGGYTFTSKSFKARVLGSIVRFLYRKSLKNADHVIFQNNDDKQEFLNRRLVSAEKCYVVNGSGVDLDKFKPTEYPQDVCFFMLSRLLKSKGVVEYLEAARKVKSVYADVRFILLGKYEYEMQDAIEPDIVEKYINDRIVERYDETADVISFYKMCSVYILPSYREGTPRTVLEAMAMARPVITTDTNGCRDTVIDGLTGYLVPVKDADKLAERMIEFIKEPKLIEKFGKASRLLCERKYDVIKVNNNMFKIMGIKE